MKSACLQGAARHAGLDDSQSGGSTGRGAEKTPAGDCSVNTRVWMKGACLQGAARHAGLDEEMGVRRARPGTHSRGWGAKGMNGKAGFTMDG
jgi:hypothetical protein